MEKKKEGERVLRRDSRERGKWCLCGVRKSCVVCLVIGR